MCGIMADMSLIGTYTKKIFPEMKIILEEKEENCGDYIGNNLINQGLTNIFTNNMLNNDTSLLIWDYLFLEGNIILIKSFIGLYACLVNILKKVPRSIESYQKIINVNLTKKKSSVFDFFILFFIIIIYYILKKIKF